MAATATGDLGAMQDFVRTCMGDYDLSGWTAQGSDQSRRHQSDQPRHGAGLMARTRRSILETGRPPACRAVLLVRIFATGRTISSGCRDAILEQR